MNPSPSASTSSVDAHRTRRALPPLEPVAVASQVALGAPPEPLPERDALTQLLSASAFEAVLEQRLHEPGRRAASLLIIDLDRFRQINDLAGRAAGDALLCQVASALRAHGREGDAVARLESDNFAMLLSDVDEETAVHLGERLRAALGALGVDHAGARLGIDATVGLAGLDGGSQSTAVEWLARARSAWYEAKYGGRGAVRRAAPMSALAVVMPV